MGDIKVRLQVGLIVTMVMTVLSCETVTACWNPPPPRCPLPCTYWSESQQKCIDECPCPCAGCIPGVGCYEDCELDEHCCCSSDNSKGKCCQQGESCCNGNCCQYGCCENDLVNEFCVTRDCGCDPIGASCSGKTEKEAGPITAYSTSGTGSKCQVPQGEVLCYRWRPCKEAGYHTGEMCIVLDPDIPQGFCTAYLWPYCQDCVGTGEWYDFMTTSTRCVAP